MPKISAKNEKVESIASKEFFSRVYAPFIGLMSLAGITFLGEADSIIEMMLVTVASIAGILGGVLPAGFLAKNRAAVDVAILLCSLGILAILGQAVIFYTSYDISESNFGWPLLAPYCVALGIIINELSGVRKSPVADTD